VLLVIASGAMGPPAPYGLRVDTGADGRLILGASLSTHAFGRDGTAYTLIGNLPYEELLSIAKEMAARDRPHTPELAVEPGR
jgi:hypothetical protein